MFKNTFQQEFALYEMRRNIMCLGIPGKVTEIDDSADILMGKIDFGGIIKDVCLAYVPEIEVGDYAIVHVGFAITRLDEQSARESLDLFCELGILKEELGIEDDEVNEDDIAISDGDSQITSQKRTS
jgi:hydrogenase expression/formation protein HypC